MSAQNVKIKPKKDRDVNSRVCEVVLADGEVIPVAEPGPQVFVRLTSEAVAPGAAHPGTVLTDPATGEGRFVQFERLDWATVR